ncbi:hypothetical protein [Streptomyces mangrovisoli]|nr:hypothetical protein [Streptomyces mangrovisoli]
MADAEPGPPPPAEEHHDERQMWWWLGYFLFGIHIVAFVMIYAVRHAPR